MASLESLPGLLPTGSDRGSCPRGTADSLGHELTPYDGRPEADPATLWHDTVSQPARRTMEETRLDLLLATLHAHLGFSPPFWRQAVLGPIPYQLTGQCTAFLGFPRAIHPARPGWTTWQPAGQVQSARGAVQYSATSLGPLVAGVSSSKLFHSSTSLVPKLAGPSLFSMGRKCLVLFGPAASTRSRDPSKALPQAAPASMSSVWLKAPWPEALLAVRMARRGARRTGGHHRNMEHS